MFKQPWRLLLCMRILYYEETNFVCKAYHAYFGIKLGDQDKPWAPHVVCHTCVSGLRKFCNGKQKSLTFCVPMVWREQVSHYDDCYFCLSKVSGYNKQNNKRPKFAFCNKTNSSWSTCYRFDFAALCNYLNIRAFNAFTQVLIQLLHYSWNYN